MQGDYAFYSANSGLTPINSFAYDDHYLAWLRIKTGRATGSVNDLESVLYSGQGGERGYYLTQLALSDSGQSLSDLKRAFLASGGGQPGTTSIYDTSTYDSTAVYA